VDGGHVTALEQALSDKIALLPCIRFADLLIEVDAWTGFSECFTHQRSARAVE
jgi:hypothetical protein